MKKLVLNTVLIALTTIAVSYLAEEYVPPGMHTHVGFIAGYLSGLIVAGIKHTMPEREGRVRQHREDFGE